jgi:hypothetical protein
MVGFDVREEDFSTYRVIEVDPWWSRGTADTSVLPDGCDQGVANLRYSVRY